MSKPPDNLGAPTPPTGLAEASLRRVIHDLRGPLNTLAILAEILRTGASPDAVAGVGRAVRGIGSMLDRLRSVTQCTAPKLVPVHLAEQLVLALARATPPDGVLLAPLATVDANAVASCPTRLPATIDTLLHCAIAALHGPGTLRFAIATSADRTELTVACDGRTAALPAANTASKLDTNDPGPADWFRLGCQVEGLAGELEVRGAATPPQIVLRMPRF